MHKLGRTFHKEKVMSEDDEIRREAYFQWINHGCREGAEAEKEMYYLAKKIVRYRRIARIPVVVRDAAVSAVVWTYNKMKHGLCLFWGWCKRQANHFLQRFVAEGVAAVVEGVLEVFFPWWISGPAGVLAFIVVSIIVEHYLHHGGMA
jgi:hypothetical protein